MRSFSAFIKEEMDAPTDSQGRILHTFVMSMAAFKEELDDMNNSDTVKVTLDDEDPNKVVLRFHQMKS